MKDIVGDGLDLDALEHGEDTGPIVVEFGPPRALHEETVAMQSLVPGQVYQHTYTGATQFSVWIATRRHRMGRPFKWKANAEREAERAAFREEMAANAGEAGVEMSEDAVRAAVDSRYPAVYDIWVEE